MERATLKTGERKKIVLKNLWRLTVFFQGRDERCP
jgi:hypothetical protein